MKIKIYDKIEEVNSLNSEICFRTGSPKGLSDRTSPKLMSYGFIGTVREALREHPDIVQIVMEDKPKDRNVLSRFINDSRYEDDIERQLKDLKNSIERMQRRYDELYDEKYRWMAGKYFRFKATEYVSGLMGSTEIYGKIKDFMFDDENVQIIMSCFMTDDENKLHEIFPLYLLHEEIPMFEKYEAEEISEKEFFTKFNSTEKFEYAEYTVEDMEKFLKSLDEKGDE